MSPLGQKWTFSDHSCPPPTQDLRGGHGISISVVSAVWLGGGWSGEGEGIDL